VRYYEPAAGVISRPFEPVTYWSHPMEGRILSHYRVLSHLGGGGMGVVYKAEDTRLKRPVALKFLPSELTRDSDARERFVQEAQAASALDHPNICTIYEIDTADDGQLFIAMAYVDGETLKKRLQRGPLPIGEAIDMAIQIARGLDKAHHAGIIHRDIKPANIMLTTDGLVKIVDFGIAKLMDHTGPTRTGTTLGTVAYMAPEQVKGGAADQRSDIWAAGVVLYEMLTGRSPFAGDHEIAVMNNIVTRAPSSVASLRPDVPAEIEHLVMRALAKLPNERYQSAAEFTQDLVRGQGTGVGAVAGVVATSWRRLSSRAIVAAAAVAVLALGVTAGWIMKRNADQQRAERELGAVTALVDRDQYAAAFARAQALEAKIPGDPRLSTLWEAISNQRSIVSDPPGVDLYMRSPVDAEALWTYVGRTPLENARLPRGVMRFRAEKQGFDTREFLLGGPGPRAAPGVAQNIRLTPNGQVPAGMLLVPRSNLSLTLTGYDYTRSVPAEDFLLDKYEVTNKQFKEFVDAGGYARPEYWKQPFVKDGRAVSWADAVAEFRDRTGRPGPSTWEVGAYPTGHDTYPVSGVSWHEAAAYAEFAGKSLPTVYHWLLAAGTGQAAYITPFSNFNGKGPVAGGTFPAVTPIGAFDMAGNVKEWCWNEVAAGQDRYILGGSWNDPNHMFVHADARSPFDRSETNGLRLVKYLGKQPLADVLTRTIEPPARDFAREQPVSDQVFDIFRSLYAYDARPLEANTEAVDATPEHWAMEKVSFQAAYGAERVVAYLFLPKNVRPPFQTVVYAPGAFAITTRNTSSLPTNNFDFLMLSGRAVLFPVYQGTFERDIGRTSPWPDMTRAYKDWMVQIINDARRSVDYLESRDDINRDTLAYYGSSWGAMFGSNVLALERRFKAGVLADGGLTPAKKPAEVDQFNFAPRVSVPVLMVNGDSDYIYQTDLSQKPLFAMLGTRPEHKRHVILRSGHGVLGQQRSQVVKEVLDWLDKYLGPVTRPS
jgi:dienelactone hydrolase/predicted Ser/Thr protein kinase